MTPAATRCGFLTSAGAWTVTGLAGPRAVAAPGDAKVLLLGTKGGPRVNKGRANPSNLVTAPRPRCDDPAQASHRQPYHNRASGKGSRAGRRGDAGVEPFRARR